MEFIMQKLLILKYRDDNKLANIKFLTMYTAEYKEMVKI